MAAIMAARCDTDLSAGTRRVPRSPAEGMIVTEFGEAAIELLP